MFQVFNRRIGCRGSCPRRSKVILAQSNRQKAIFNQETNDLQNRETRLPKNHSRQDSTTWRADWTEFLVNFFLDQTRRKSRLASVASWTLGIDDWLQKVERFCQDVGGYERWRRTKRQIDGRFSQYHQRRGSTSVRYASNCCSQKTYPHSEQRKFE